LELARLALVILQAQLTEAAQERTREREWRERAWMHATGATPPQPGPGGTAAAAHGTETRTSSGATMMKRSEAWSTVAFYIKEALAWSAALSKAAPAFTWAWRICGVGWLGWLGNQAVRWLGLW
jgi:hypothetical protein